MNYHETVPTAYGLYLIERNELLFLRRGEWIGDGGKPVDDVERFLPMLGPLPDTDDAMLSLACEVAFARMVVADYQWCSGNGTGPTTDEATRDVMPRLSGCEHRFVRKGERSLSLLREMERVTGELSSPPAPGEESA